MFDDTNPPSGDGPAPAEELANIYAALEEGEVLDGLELALDLERTHPNDGDVALAHAVAAHQAGFSRDCLEAALRAGELGCDSPHLQRFYVASSRFRLWEMDEASAIITELVREVEDFADAWFLYAQIREFLGDEIGARRGYREASRLAAEIYPMPTRISEEVMQQVIERAVHDLPSEFHEALGQVPVTVRDLPDWEMVKPLAGDEDPFPPDLLGLFVGSSRLDQSVFNPVEEAGVIFLFQKNLERICPDQAVLEEEIRLTVWHELAHYLGFTEEDMEEMGLE